MQRLPHGLPSDGHGEHEGATLPRLRLNPTQLIPWLLAAVGGVCLSLAFPPARVWPLVFAVPVAWLAALLTGGEQRPFLIGFALGVVGYAPMLSWVSAPAGSLAWVLLVAFEAALVGLATVLVRPWLRHPGMPFIAALAWTGVDFMRSWIPLKGFEWGALQYAHVDGSWLLPTARIAGGRSLTFLTVLIAAAAFHLVASALADTDSQESLSDRLRLGLPTARGPALILVAAMLVSAVATVEPPSPSGETIDVLVAQGNNIEERVGSAREEDAQIARNLLELTREAIGDGPVPDLVVWPENAFDRDPWAAEGADLLPIMEEAAELTEGRLLAGVNRVGPRPNTFHNSQVLVGADGEIADLYVKQHYVPFGEYVPFRSVLGDFPPLRKVPRDGIPEPVRDSIHVGSARIAVGICFETLFGRVIRHNIQAGDQDANLLVMSTSDSTFGRTGEPEQHLSQSRMRAVETGRWVIHAASSGVSTLIAPDGSVGERTELFTLATQRFDVPLVDEATPWLRVGNVINWPLGLGLLWLMAVVVSRRRTSSRAVDNE